MRTVRREEWAQELGALAADGFAFLDYLTGIDRLDEIEVVAHVVDPASGAHELVSTRVPAGDARLASVTPLFPGAGWHERETAEMLGIVFDGHPDPRPLLLHCTVGAAPLRKSNVLAARAVVPWPGAADPGGSPSRRRTTPPGVPDGWLQEPQP